MRKEYRKAVRARFIRSLSSALPGFELAKVRSPLLFGGESVRAQGRYARSLELLSAAKEIRPGQFTKSGLMVGLGETTKSFPSARALPGPWTYPRASSASETCGTGRTPGGAFRIPLWSAPGASRRSRRASHR